MPNTCVVCRTRPGRVCRHCLDDIDRQLRELPDRYTRLAAALTPGRAEQGERVSVSQHVHAGLPLRADVLSLIGPGGDVPATLHPMVRHWSAKRTVRVTTHIVGRAHTVDVEVTDWFHELVVNAAGQPVMVPDDDQIGVVPPREWLDLHVRRWRSHFGHHVPDRTLPVRGRGYVHPAYRTLITLPAGPATIGFLAAAHRATGSLQRMAYRGLLHDRHPDPAVDAIERRTALGEPPRTMGWDIAYLRTWLEKACSDEQVDVAEFAAQLHTLHAEINRALGDQTEQSWVGRCPATLDQVDVDGQLYGRKRICGAGLWQEHGAYLSAQVRCPRCRSTWDIRGHAGASTAREIRRAWPIDRRRRYTATEIDRLPHLKCPTCSRRVTVHWRDVTGTRDPARTWQPTDVTCPAGCDDARRML